MLIFYPKMMRTLVFALLAQAAFAYNSGLNKVTCRRVFLGSAAVVGTSSAASPALALRSVLDEESQQSFDDRQAKKNAPPPPPKTLQETLGVARPEGIKVYERKVDRKRREEYEAALAAQAAK